MEQLVPLCWLAGGMDNYLVDNGFLSTTNGLQPPLSQYSRLLRNSVEVPAVVSASVARAEFTVWKAACCGHTATFVFYSQA